MVAPLPYIPRGQEKQSQVDEFQALGSNPQPSLYRQGGQQGPAVVPPLPPLADERADLPAYGKAHGKFEGTFRLLIECIFFYQF